MDFLLNILASAIGFIVAVYFLSYVTEELD